MLNIRAIRVLSLLIMVGAASASFMTQRTLFLGWQVDSYSAVIAPLAVDALAIICTLALHTPGRRKGIPVTVLILAGGASIAANWIAGATVGAKAVHAGLVGLYLLAEWVASQQVVEPVAVATVVVAAQGEEFGAVREATPEPVMAKAPRRRKTPGKYYPAEAPATA
jgi:hypothetical protein